MSIPFTFRQLEAFIAVSRAGSITGAADDLLSSPSAVSAAITELERGLGVTLFERKRSKGVLLTTHGEHLKTFASTLLEGAAAAASAVAETDQEIQGTIRLGSYSSLSATLLPILLAEFSRDHPQVLFELPGGNQDELRQMLDKGEIDVALTYNRFLTPDVNFRRIQRRHPYVLLARDHPRAGQSSVTLAELQDENFILLDLYPSRENTLSWFEEANIRPRIKWVTKEAALARGLVGRGLGYTILLQPYGHNYTVDGSEVVPLPLEPRPSPIDVFVVWRTLPSGEPLRIRKFVDHISASTEHFPEMTKGGEVRDG
ncbi:LysR family transcriptional regulator [Corynebacterium hylobatis]|uniref:LysR family transcriptional regulator n=1 Tax=Corynebacterium hylobatis TaxID=1859290 RepID=A0A3R9ZDG0_9CORY|nr:LysR family transcriptional regulator [Corynebacterium hylobatis]RSZ61908.1 LysR family transcriptional regulator [Corynebacterium hylobatis]